MQASLVASLASPHPTHSTSSASLSPPFSSVITLPTLSHPSSASLSPLYQAFPSAHYATTATICPNRSNQQTNQRSILNIDYSDSYPAFTPATPEHPSPSYTLLCNRSATGRNIDLRSGRRWEREATGSNKLGLAWLGNNVLLRLCKLHHNPPW